MVANDRRFDPESTSTAILPSGPDLSVPLQDSLQDSLRDYATTLIWLPLAEVFWGRNWFTAASTFDVNALVIAAVSGSLVVVLVVAVGLISWIRAFAVGLSVALSVAAVPVPKSSLAC